MALDWGPVPEDATYLGTPMGGEFVRLTRQDILLDGNLTLPAYHMEIYAAGSKGAAYGEERYGALLFSGFGLYVPPAQTHAPFSESYEVPTVQFVLENGWVNSDVLHVRMKPKAQDPDDRYIGLILPLNLSEDAQ